MLLSQLCGAMFSRAALCWKLITRLLQIIPSSRQHGREASNFSVGRTSLVFCSFFRIYTPDLFFVISRLRLFINCNVAAFFTRAAEDRGWLRTEAIIKTIKAIIPGLGWCWAEAGVTMGSPENGASWAGRPGQWSRYMDDGGSCKPRTDND